MIKLAFFESGKQMGQPLTRDILEKKTDNLPNQINPADG
jgi:hypothetical protein